MRIRWRVGRNLSVKVGRGGRGSPQGEGKYREDRERKEYEKGSEKIQRGRSSQMGDGTLNSGSPKRNSNVKCGENVLQEIKKKGG